jgi:phosphate transport system substrate-binding protein
MLWIWRSGGVDLSAGDAPMRQTEECSAVIAGSTAMTVRLAPSAVAAFLRNSGYEIDSGAAPPTEGVQVVGLRGPYRCTVTIRTSTSTQGLRDLASGEALIAMSHRPMTQRDIAMLRAANAGDFVEQRAQAEHVVGFDAYAMMVAESNPVQSISLDDAREVALSAIANWRRLGGPDANITLYAIVDGVSPEDYPNDIIQATSPEWETAAVDARVFATEGEAVRALANDPTGLGFISGAFAGNGSGVRALAISTDGPAHAATADNVRGETYPLARRLFLYVRPADMQSNAFVQRFVRFMQSPEAFDLIDDAGFVALRPESRLSRNAANLSGCRFGTPEYAALMTVTQGASRLPVELRFAPGGDALDDASQAYVAANAEQFRQRLRAGEAVILIGHTDVSGSIRSNRSLALQRAFAVRTAFENLGVFGMAAESAGEACSLDNNETPEGRQRNRRVEIWVRPREVR